MTTAADKVIPDSAVGEIKEMLQSLDEIIAEVHKQIEAQDEKLRELQATRSQYLSALEKAVELRNYLAHNYMRNTQKVLPFAEETLIFPSLPLGEAIEIILKKAGRPMTQGEIVKALGAFGVHLGRLAGRRIHAATLRNPRIHKPEPRVYEWLDASEINESGDLKMEKVMALG